MLLKKKGKLDTLFYSLLVFSKYNNVKSSFQQLQQQTLTHFNTLCEVLLIQNE